MSPLTIGGLVLFAVALLIFLIGDIRKQQSITRTCLVAMVILLGIVLVSLARGNRRIQPESQTYQDPNLMEDAASDQQTVSFSGSTYTAVCTGCETTEVRDDEFYITMDIANTGAAPCTYRLQNVTADGVVLQTDASQLVNAEAGETLSTGFIVFCDVSLTDIEEVQFVLVVRDDEAAAIVETSDTITIYPNR